MTGTRSRRPTARLGGAVIGRVARLLGAEAVARRTYSRRRVGIIVYHDPTPATLEAHLRFLSPRYAFVTMTQLAEALSTGDWSRVPTPAVAVTFDDGHRGNVHLEPSLVRYDVHPTIYLCSGVTLGDGMLWFRAPGVDPEPLKLLSPAERAASLESITPSAPDGEADERHALTVDEVRALRGAADFGSHTVTHPVLPLCTDAESEEEITRSRLEVERIAGAPCLHFSYPNGDYTEREVGLVRRAGYATARTTDIGWVGPGSDPLRLEIISLADHASVEVLAAHLVGLLAVKRRGPAIARRRRLAAKRRAAVR